MAWVSASDQLHAIGAREADATELRDAGIRRCEELNPKVGFLASPMFERAPVGVQIVGRHGSDGALLGLAITLQAHLGWLACSPPTFAT